MDPDSIGGTEGDRILDLLTARFEPVVEPIEFTGLNPAQSGIAR